MTHILGSLPWEINLRGANRDEGEQNYGTHRIMDSQGNILTLKRKLTYSIDIALGDDWDMESVDSDSDNYCA